MSEVYGSVSTMIDKDELIRLLEENFMYQVEQDEETWDELLENGDEEAVAFDKGWQTGFSYALYLIGKNF